MQIAKEPLGKKGARVEKLGEAPIEVPTPLEEMLRAFDDLVRQGKVLYTACSNYEAWRLVEALWLSDSNRWARFEAYQAQYSLVVRDIDILQRMAERDRDGLFAARGLAHDLDVADHGVEDDQQFILDLLLEEKVLLVQGSGFNWKSTDHFRAVFLPNLDDLKEAITRIGRFLEQYRKKHGAQ